MDHFEPGSRTLDKACKAKKDASRTQGGKQSKERAEHASFTVFIILEYCRHITQASLCTTAECSSPVADQHP